MNRPVRFRPQAEAEALETRDWYESRRRGLGAGFRAALDETIGRVVANPLMYRRVRGETRRAILDRFPYAVYFREEATTRPRSRIVAPKENDMPSCAPASDPDHA